MESYSNYFGNTFYCKRFIVLLPFETYIVKKKEIKRMKKKKRFLSMNIILIGVLKSKWHNGIGEYYRRNGVLEYIQKEDTREDYDEEGKIINCRKIKKNLEQKWRI